VTSGIDKLTDRQRRLLREWLPGATVTKDHSWGLVGTVVLALDHEGAKYIAKAGDASDLHIAREVKAHREWLSPWTSHQRAPELVHADLVSKLIVCLYLEGELVLGSDHEWQVDTYRQAGVLLAMLHEQFSREDPEFELRQKAKALTWLDGPHRIAALVEAELRKEIGSWPSPSVCVVPTHGDWCAAWLSGPRGGWAVRLAALPGVVRSKAAAPGGIAGRPGGRVDPSARASGCSQRWVASGPLSAARSSAATGICSWGMRSIAVESAWCLL